MRFPQKKSFAIRISLLLVLNIICIGSCSKDANLFNEKFRIDATQNPLGTFQIKDEYTSQENSTETKELDASETEEEISEEASAEDSETQGETTEVDVEEEEKEELNSDTEPTEEPEKPKEETIEDDSGDEEQDQLEEERQRQEEEAAEQQRLAEEQQRQEEEAAEQQQIAEEERQRQEEEAAEQQRLAEEQQRQEEEAAEQQRIAEEERRQRQEEEAAEQQRLAEEQQRRQEEEQRRQQEQREEEQRQREAQEELERRQEQQQLLQLLEQISIFPSNHPLNKSIRNNPVDEYSDLILNHIGLEVFLFADFGSGTYKGEPKGVPYEVVGADQPKVPITYRANNIDGNYGHQSDQGPFPIPLDATIEAEFVGDAHVITVDVENGMLYELYNASRSADGWEASSGAVFDLKTVEFRPDGWTSADAAGLPIFPLLLRYAEVETGVIDHAIRFSLDRSKIYEGYVHPARHLTGGAKGNHLLPFGARLRLKADFDTNGYSQANQVILRAMKEYGLILADSGRDMFLKGEPNEKWDNLDLRKLRNLKVSDFEVVKLGQITTR